jgi:hypothetical protein
MEAKITGVTPEMLAELANEKVILENIRWKPDKVSPGKQLFFPYLPIDFVKPRLFDILGAENMEFILEKDQERYALGRLGIRFSHTPTEMQYYTAIGVEKEGKNVKDQEKRDKVKFKGNVADTIKSCAEWLGLMVPASVTEKWLTVKDKKAYTDKGELIGTIYENDKISAYLNGLSQTRYLISKVYQLNKKTFKENERLLQCLQELMEGLKDAK